MRREFNRMRKSFIDQCTSGCGNCGSIKDIEVHHIVPIASGGTNRYTNLAALCSDCHVKAHGRKINEGFRDLQRQGISRAKEDGKYTGRQKNNELHAAIIGLLDMGVGIRAASRIVGCSATTVMRAKKEMSGNQ